QRPRAPRHAPRRVHHRRRQRARSSRGCYHQRKGRKVRPMRRSRMLLPAGLVLAIRVAACGGGDAATDGTPSRREATDAAGPSPTVDVAAAPEDATEPPDARLDAQAGALWAEPSLPAFDAETSAHVIQVFAKGKQRAKRGSVVAKIGDSNSV